MEMSVKPGGGHVKLGSWLTVELDSSSVAWTSYHHGSTQAKCGRWACFSEEAEVRLFLQKKIQYFIIYWQKI